VVGSDGVKIGDLKTVGDADLMVERTLRGDLHVPVRHVREVTADDKIVLDVSAEAAGRVSPTAPAWRREPWSSRRRTRKRPNRERRHTEAPGDTPGLRASV